eukprot:TRINITY_DN6380_c0_g1_i4.p1 TRINITY_DN6380_c0_g1~~TRINITY_DN6380_c0_g1_i4.p1  ORF type:complete len:409 (+),score=96.34 TRINITY_DN6380_c0_g1_i4:302-1528(+)
MPGAKQSPEETSTCRLALTVATPLSYRIPTDLGDSRDFTWQNALLQGDLETYVKHQEPLPWMHELPDLPSPAARLRRILQEARYGEHTFFAKHTEFLWGVDISGTGRGVLVPPQPEPSDFGRIPGASRAGGGDAEGTELVLIIRNVGRGVTAGQVYALVGMYGHVAAVVKDRDRLHAQVMFRDRQSARACFAGLAHNRHDGAEGDTAGEAHGPSETFARWKVYAGTRVLQEWDAPDNVLRAFSAGGGGGKAGARGVSLVLTRPPAVHEELPAAPPSRWVLLWATAAYGFAHGMEQVFVDAVRTHRELYITKREGAPPVDPEAPQQPPPAVTAVPDVGGRVSYAVEFREGAAALDFAADVNGCTPEDLLPLKHWLGTARRRNLSYFRVGVAFLHEKTYQRLIARVMVQL